MDQLILRKFIICCNKKTELLITQKVNPFYKFINCILIYYFPVIRICKIVSRTLYELIEWSYIKGKDVFFRIDKTKPIKYGYALDWFKCRYFCFIFRKFCEGCGRSLVSISSKTIIKSVVFLNLFKSIFLSSWYLNIITFKKRKPYWPLNMFRTKLTIACFFCASLIRTLSWFYICTFSERHFGLFLFWHRILL